MPHKTIGVTYTPSMWNIAKNCIHSLLYCINPFETVSLYILFYDYSKNVCKWCIFVQNTLCFIEKIKYLSCKRHSFSYFGKTPWKQYKLFTFLLRYIFPWKRCCFYFFHKTQCWVYKELFSIKDLKKISHGNHTVFGSCTLRTALSKLPAHQFYVCK